MKMDLGKEQNLNQTMQRWKAQIESDFKGSIKQHRTGYNNLFRIVSTELLETTQEFHPEYFRPQGLYLNEMQTMKSTIQYLYRVSVIQNYIKAKAKGHDLHVICYGDAQRGFLENFTANIGVQWNIDNSTTHMLVDNIIEVHQC